jgi:hypothetical protein
MRVIQSLESRVSTPQQSLTHTSVVSAMGNLAIELVARDPNSLLHTKHEKSVSLHILGTVFIQGYITKITTALLFFLSKK